MAQDQFQYIRMPDGSYGKFRADATTEQIRAAVLKDFPNAYGQRAQPITDTTTIGPKKTFSNIAPTTPSPGVSGMLADKLGLTEAARAGSQLFNATNPIEGYNAAGRAEHPALSRLGDLTASLKELLFGGQSAGKPMGTQSGLVNNPVSSAMAVAPGVAESLENLSSMFRRKNELIARVLRGPGATGDVTANPATMATRELENAIPRKERPWTPEEIRAQRDKGLTEQAETLMRRQKEQDRLDKLASKSALPKTGSPEKEAGYYPPLTKVPIRPEPPVKVTPEQIPGPDTAGKGNLLTPGAKRGDPRFAAELQRRGRNVLYVPAEEYPAPRSKDVLGAIAPLAASVPQLSQNGSVKYAHTSNEQISPMRGFPESGANIESPSGKKISYFASAGSPKPPKSGTLGEMAYDDKKGNILAWNGTKWVEANDANRQEIRTKIADERAHLVGEFYKGGQLSKDQVMIFARQKLIGMKDARSIINGKKEETRSAETGQ